MRRFDQAVMSLPVMSRFSCSAARAEAQGGEPC